MEIKTVVIDRSKWRTGFLSENATGQGPTKLRNSEGCQCCLGFISEACGISAKDTFDKFWPQSTDKLIPYLTEEYEFGIKDTALSEAAMEINDNADTTQAEKEVALKELFAGKINLEFVGEPVKYEG